MGEKSFQNMTLHLKKHNICHVYEINILLQAIHSGKYTTADYVRICRENKYSIKNSPNYIYRPPDEGNVLVEPLKVVRGTPRFT
jgi:hypothetical protein